jgi:phage gpG-like protein
MIVWYTIGTDVVYARIQELGGTIRPKHGRWLVFEIDGEIIFARSVTIPARPYMRPGFDESVESSTAVIAATFKKMVIDPAVRL